MVVLDVAALSARWVSQFKLECDKQLTYTPTPISLLPLQPPGDIVLGAVVFRAKLSSRAQGCLAQGNAVVLSSRSLCLGQRCCLMPGNVVLGNIVLGTTELFEIEAVVFGAMLLS
jgi:hypothetical protein